MKKKVLLLVLGILGAYQLGYSENVDTKVEKTQNVETEKTQNENVTETIKTEELNQTAEPAIKEEETQVNTMPVQNEVPKTKKLTPTQEKKLEAKAKRNKEKNMSLDEKLDLQILKMERLLKSLEGR